MKNTLPPDAVYIENCIGQETQKHLVALLDNITWSKELKRRVQHFGYIYDYRTRKIDHSHKIGEIPDFLK